MNIGAEASIPSRRSWNTCPISCRSSRTHEADRERPAPDQRVGGDRDQHRRRGRQQLQLRQQQQDGLQLRRQQQRGGGERPEEALEPLAPALPARAGMDRLVVVLRRGRAREPAPEFPNRCWRARSSPIKVTDRLARARRLSSSARARLPGNYRCRVTWLDPRRRPAGAGRPAHGRAPAADGRGRRRPRLPGGDGLARAALGAVRRGVGVAGGDDELRGRPRGPRSPRGRDRAPARRSSTGSSTRARRGCSAASTSTRPSPRPRRAPTRRSRGG